MSFKPEILRLRELGYTYKMIVEEIGCSVGVVCFHLGEGQREKDRRRHLNSHARTPIYSKTQAFKGAKTQASKSKACQKRMFSVKQKIEIRMRSFSCLIKNGPSTMLDFTADDVLAKFGDSPQCYLTGELIDLTKSRTYQFDHIIPRSRGGDNSLENLGLCTSSVNKAKHNLTPEEFLLLCNRAVDFNKTSPASSPTLDITGAKRTYQTKDGANNQSFCGKTDQEIVDFGVDFFVSHGNKIWPNGWQRHSKLNGLPTGYSKCRFGGKGYVGFFEALKTELTKRNISWDETSFSLTKEERYGGNFNFD